MERQAVSSSNIKSVGYDKKEKTLEVEFHNGRTYWYFKVSPRVHEGIMSAPSAGKFFHRMIKEKYDYQQVLVD